MFIQSVRSKTGLRQGHREDYLLSVMLQFLLEIEDIAMPRPLAVLVAFGG